MIVLGDHRAIRMLDKLGFDDSDYSVVVKRQGTPSEPVEVGDLSRRYVKPHRAIADLFSQHRGR